MVEPVLTDMQTIIDDIRDRFSAQVPLIELPADPYTRMRYPKMVPIMRFDFQRFDAPLFGHASFLRTTGMGGRMQLATVVFTPNTGTNVPLLLIDAMAMKQKRAVFVEYYDCTAQGAPADALSAVHDRYADLPDYLEKPAWYIAERTPYSLIKGADADARLCAMINDTVDAYAALCASASGKSPENIEGLRGFVDRMVEEGNPSSATMTKVLGASGAETFFRSAVMPVDRP